MDSIEERFVVDVDAFDRWGGMSGSDRPTNCRRARHRHVRAAGSARRDRAPGICPGTPASGLTPTYTPSASGSGLALEQGDRGRRQHSGVSACDAGRRRATTGTCAFATGCCLQTGRVGSPAGRSRSSAPTRASAHANGALAVLGRRVLPVRRRLHPRATGAGRLRRRGGASPGLARRAQGRRPQGRDHRQRRDGRHPGSGADRSGSSA